jgi:hypothetical protein
MGKINGVDLSNFQPTDGKRAEAKRKFAAELYLAGSFFKQRRFTEGDSHTPLQELDVRIKDQSGAIEPMANEHVTTRYIPERDKMPKFPKGR